MVIYPMEAVSKNKQNNVHIVCRNVKFFLLGNSIPVILAYVQLINYFVLFDVLILCNFEVPGFGTF